MHADTGERRLPCHVYEDTGEKRLAGRCWSSISMRTREKQFLYGGCAKCEVYICSMPRRVHVYQLVTAACPHGIGADNSLDAFLRRPSPANAMWPNVLYSGFETCLDTSTQGARIRYYTTSQIQIFTPFQKHGWVM